MNKAIIELKQERADAIEKMSTILDTCKKESRVKSESESDAFDNSEDLVMELDEQIIEAEKMERLNKSIEVKNTPMKEVEKIQKRYSLSKAITGLRDNNLDGLEKEMSDEARDGFGGSNGLLIPEFLWNKEARADYSFSGQKATDVATEIAGLDVIATTPLYNMLGCTIWNGLKNKVILNFSDGHNAAFPGEGTTVAESTPTRANDALEPKRVGGKKGFSNELLSVSAVMNTEFSDMIMSVDRAISAKVVSDANLVSIDGAHEAADASVNLSYSSMISMQAGLESDSFVSPKYVMSKPLYHTAQALSVDTGSGRFIVENGAVGGTPVFGTTQLPIHTVDQYDMIYGDWSRAYVGFFGGAMELLIDPYTDGAIGVTNIIFNRLADVALNPAAFVSYRNTHAVNV